MTNSKFTGRKEPFTKSLAACLTVARKDGAEGRLVTRQSTLVQALATSRGRLREGGREGGKEGGKEGGREGGREGDRGEEGTEGGGRNCM